MDMALQQVVFDVCIWRRLEVNKLPRCPNKWTTLRDDLIKTKGKKRCALKKKEKKTAVPFPTTFSSSHLPPPLSAPGEKPMGESAEAG